MERSPRFNTVKDHYDAHRWTETMVKNAVGKWITKEEAAEILGETPEAAANE